MEPREGIPLTRGVFVRFTTERFDGEGVPRNTEGLTLYQDDVYFPREFHLEWPDPEL